MKLSIIAFIITLVFIVFFILGKKEKNETQSLPYKTANCGMCEENSKTLVLYVFHKYNDRVEYFIKNALFEAPDVDFVFICNDLTFDIQSRLPYYVKSFRRENKGYDFGAWSDLLINHGYAYADYDTFIFANSSITGPFMGKHKDERWTDIFRDGLNDDVKLYGVTINCEQYNGNIDARKNAHVQSYLFSVKKSTLLELIEDGIFSEIYIESFQDLIINKEVAMSRMIIKRGGNIGCTHGYYKGVDWRFINKQPSDYPIVFTSDIMHSHLMNIVWTPDELVFFKGNRLGNNNILSVIRDKLYYTFFV
jgi:lipopolysaccharide biosynthesis protein